MNSVWIEKPIPERKTRNRGRKDDAGVTLPESLMS
jgi:hypothetical protein